LQVCILDAPHWCVEGYYRSGLWASLLVCFDEGFQSCAWSVTSRFLDKKPNGPAPNNSAATIEQADADLVSILNVKNNRCLVAVHHLVWWVGRRDDDASDCRTR
jgi:hypothetical protein